MDPQPRSFNWCLSHLSASGLCPFTPHAFWTGAEKSVLLVFLPHLHDLSLIGIKGDCFLYDIKAETFILVMELLDMQWMNKSVIQILRTRMHQ